MIKILLIIITCVISITCQQTQVSDIIGNENFAVFVEAKTNNNSVSSGEYGELVLFNLSTNEKKYLTNDHYYDFEPSISSSGERIVFKSNRYYENSDPRFIGAGSLSGVYIYDLINDRFLNMTDILGGKKPSILDNFQWDIKDKAIYYLQNGNLLYEYDFNTNKKNKILEFPLDKYVHKFLFVPNEKCIIINQSKNKKMQSNLMKYDLESKAWSELDSIGTINLYSAYNDGFIFSRNRLVYSYDLLNDSADYLFDLYINDRIYVKECFKINEMEYLILGSIENKNRLLIYNSSLNEVNFITDGEKDIECLDVYLAEE